MRQILGKRFACNDPIITDYNSIELYYKLLCLFVMYFLTPSTSIENLMRSITSENHPYIIDIYDLTFQNLHSYKQHH